MKIACILASAALVLALPAAALAQDCPTCATAKEKDGWCSDCKVGYIGGEKSKCRSCFDIRTSGKSGWCEDCKVGYAQGLKTKCKSCLAAIGGDGWCEDCKVGYVAAQKTTCKSCFGLMKAKDGGWCDGCKVGYALGVKTSCKSCLGAIRADGWCEDCKVGYVKAQKTKCRNCFGLMKAKDGGWCADCDVGHALGLKTKCRKCFEAIKTNGACADCKRSFKDGAAFKIVHIHIHGLNKEKVRAVLEKIDGVTNVRFGEDQQENGRVDLDLKETSKTKVNDLVEALKKAGFTAHEGEE